MSRCFPYPPPGYVRNEALVESIKKEIKEAKKEMKKEKRQEKKEKHKDKNLENGEDVNNKHSHKRKHKVDKDKKKGDREKKRRHENEQNDKSSLTEEFGLPVNFHNSSNSTLKSSKAQIKSSPMDDQHNPANIFRIRLPLQRHKDPQVHRPYSPPSRSDDFTSERSENVLKWSKNASDCPCSTSASTGRETNLPTKEGFSPFSLSVEASAFLTSFSNRSISRSELKYKYLLESWNPPPLQSENLDQDDLDWLFQRKLNQVCTIEQVKAENDSSNPWPWSCYLQEADVHALPYTMPY